jgi:hypothetical protein
VVHNIKSNSQRLVRITPSSTWGGAGLLGVTIRLDNYGGADERLIRVLSVEHNSPAAIAGLVPESDYLLGTTSASFDSDQMLAEVLMVHSDRIVEIYVYSSESDMVRVVTLMPTLSWGGRGLLGAEVGTGYLHGFPASCRKTDGASVERKIRMGVRPTEATALECKKDGGDNTTTEDAEDEGDMVDLTALTDSMSGKAMCFAEQMEMEPEPVDDSQGQSQRQEMHQPSSESNDGNKNGHATNEETPVVYATEADALFSRPPPGDGAMTPIKQQSNEAPYSPGFVPPPLYDARAVSPGVDLR